MSCKELYDSFMDYSRKGDVNSATAIAISWLNQEKENPFQAGTPERELFFKASRCFKKWQLGGIDSRVSRVRMENYVKELGALNALNPYNTVESGFRVLGVVPEEKEEVPEIEVKKEEPHIEENEDAITAEKNIVLGVVPEEKPRIFNKRKKR